MAGKSKKKSELSIAELPETIYINERLADGRATVEFLDPKTIERKSEFQARDLDGLDFNPRHVLDLAAARDRGEEMPPIVVFRFKDGRYQVGDGFHRLIEAIKRGDTKIKCYVVDADEHEAKQFVVMCNRRTALPKTDKCREKTLWIIFSDTIMFTWADNRICDILGYSVSHVSIARLRFCEETGISLPVFVFDKINRKLPFKTRRTLGTKEITRREGHSKVSKSQHIITIRGKIFKSTNSGILDERVNLAKEKLARTGTFFDLSRWLTNRCVLSETRKSGFSVRDAIHGIVVGNRSVVTTDLLVVIDGRAVTSTDFSVEPLKYVVGQLMMYTQAVDPTLKMTLVCYPEFGNKKALDIVRALGIDIMTPEELVAEYHARRGTPGYELEPEPQPEPDEIPAFDDSEWDAFQGEE